MNIRYGTDTDSAILFFDTLQRNHSILFGIMHTLHTTKKKIALIVN